MKSRFTLSLNGETYRRTAVAISLLLASIVLAACGSSNEAGSSGSTEGSSASVTVPEPSSAQESAFPVTIEHKFGITEIAEEPERVVTVGLSDQDPLLALGIKPVAVTEWYTDYPVAFPWAEDELGDAQPEVLGSELNFEKITALRPDLIIGLYSGLTEEQYTTLSQIAPTVAQSGEYVDYGMPWQEMTRVVGRSVGREQRADELIADVEARFAQARREHPEFTGAAAVLAQRSSTAGQFAAVAPETPRWGFLAALGFEVPEEISELFAAAPAESVSISGEQLGLFDHDALVWFASGEDSDLRATLGENPIYQQLEVAREGRDLFLEDQVVSAALSWSTVLSLPFAVDALVPQLAAVADGNPATEPASAS